MGEMRKNATERRLSHVRALKEQFFSEHEAESSDLASQLRNRDAQLEANESELKLAAARIAELDLQLRQRESELAGREALINELEGELEQLRLRLVRRMPIAETTAPTTNRRPADDAPRFDFYTSD